MRTGSGAGRQDVNVSVTGGTRIEIKGVSSLRAIPRLVHNEALRQRTLVGIQGELERRGITPEDIDDKGYDVTAHVRGHRVPVHRQAIAKGATVMAIPLPGFQGLLQLQTQPRTSFLKEFSDRVRVIACIDDLPNLAVSTQDMPTLSSGEWDRVTRACGVEVDVPVLVSGVGKRTWKRPCGRSPSAPARPAWVCPRKRARPWTTAPTASSASARGGPHVPGHRSAAIALTDERVDGIRARLGSAPLGA